MGSEVNGLLRLYKQWGPPPSAELKSSIKLILKDIFPPIMLRAAKSLYRLIREENNSLKPSKMFGPEWYDTFASHKAYRVHYTESEYYFLWSVIVDRILRDNISSVLDIGCGSGQLAELLRDKGIKEYHGIDFSPKLIELAKQRGLKFNFTIADIFQTDILEKSTYDAVIATEFFEHIDEDIEIISKIRHGTRCYASVPNFAYPSHLRYFRNSTQVHKRYSIFFRKFQVDPFRANEQGKTYYLFSGIRNKTTLSFDSTEFKQLHE
ncbi:class I SAM-dependent methyltransferase [Thermodesulfobacteriota bacterium]